MKRLMILALMAASALATPALAGPKPAVVSANSLNKVYVGNAPSLNTSPSDNGFTCFAKYLAKDTRRPVFSVGRLTDQSGKFSNEAQAGGFAVTQGLTNMVYTAMGKLAPDFAIVERTDMSVVEADMAIFDRAKNQFGQGLLLGDTAEKMKDREGLRTLKPGQFMGADYYITGAITEVNYNIDSGGAEFGVQGIGVGKRTYTMSVAMDLRVVDAKTLRVVKTVSPVKTFKGYETKAGVFNFLGDYLIDINAGKKAQEPLQLGVRATMESALIELVGAVYGTNYGATCSAYANQNYGNIVPVAQADPIGDVLASSSK